MEKLDCTNHLHSINGRLFWLNHLLGTIAIDDCGKFYVISYYYKSILQCFHYRHYWYKLNVFKKSSLLVTLFIECMAFHGFVHYHGTC